MLRKTVAIALSLAIIFAFAGFLTLPAQAVEDNIPGDDSPIVTQASSLSYAPKEDAVIAGFRAQYNASLAHKVAGRAIWYMLYGFMVYGHEDYVKTGYIDCSGFVRRVYRDWGYNVTGVSRDYNTLGTEVQGVYSRPIPGTTRWELVGAENLKPGDIMTWWKDEDKHIGHVGIYIGNINGQPCTIMTIKGRPTAIGILTAYRYWYGEHFAGARRILPATAHKANYSRNGYTPAIPAVYQMQPMYPVVMPADLPQRF